MGEEVVENLSLVIVGIVGHECKSKGWEGVVLVVKGSPVGLHDGGIVSDELNEVVDYIGEKDSEEESCADEGWTSRDSIVFGDGDEGEDI